MKILPLRTVFAIAVLAASGAAQGRSSYCNFESPQVKPIATGRVNGVQIGRNYLFVCNTPDNSVEVYNLTANRDNPPFVARIQVGLEPVSVVFHTFTAPTTRHMLYTVNWLGDSVTIVELSLVGGGINPTFRSQVLTEVPVTAPTSTHVVVGSGPTLQSFLRCDDEPMHLAVLDGPAPDVPTQTLVVSKRTASSYSLIDAFTGATRDALDITGATITGGGANVIMLSDVEVGDAATVFDGEVGQSPLTRPLPAAGTVALKEPHTVLRRPGTTNEIWVLAHKGGGSDLDHDFSPPDPTAIPRFDFDAWGMRFNPAGTPPDFFAIRKLGVTNFNMAFSGDGNVLYVVGTDPSDGVFGNGNLLDSSQRPTGFVRTMLYRVDMQLPGALQAFDLNLRNGVAAAKSASLAHVTDIAVYRPGTEDFLCVTGFNSDTFGVVSLSTTPATIRTCSVENAGTGVPTTLVGPRGLAILTAANPANDRVYVHNRFDNSFTVVNPQAGVAAPLFVAKIALQRSGATDPVPASVRAGQQFLYSTEFSSNGFSSCASCHTDGRSDNQQWRLSTAVAATFHLNVPTTLGMSDQDALEEEAWFNDLITGGFPVDGDAPTPNANNKGPMITQSLQGLVNFEVGGNLFDIFNGNRADDIITNAPYHWRGDKENFKHFNEAFVNLMGAASAPPEAGVPGGALTSSQLLAYEQFINSIHYPPNPMEPIARVHSGTPWTDQSLQLATNADVTGMQGQKLFHLFPVGGLGGRSCIQCHAGTAGSNFRLTCATNAQDPNLPLPPMQPIETTALRGITQKEGLLELDAVVPTVLIPLPRLRTGDLGLLHEGLNNVPSLQQAPGQSPQTRNEFMDLVGAPAPLTGVESARARTAINTYMREFDHGIAPIVGMSRTVTSANKTAGDIVAAMNAMEGQVHAANSGLAVYGLVLSGSTLVERGYWYRLDPSGGVYKQIGGGTLTRSALLAQIDAATELLIFRATPAGSEARIATLGAADAPTSAVASDVQIVGTTPNTANAVVVGIGAPALTNNWVLGTGPTDFNWAGALVVPPVPEPLSLRTVKGFQAALSASGVQVAHDVPRRIQVGGFNFVPGAAIRLSWSADPARVVELPIFPTNRTTWIAIGHTATEVQIWETFAEFDPLQLYVMMCGGTADVDVQCALSGGATCNPVTAKNVTVSVRNTPQQAWSAGASMPLKYPRQ